MIADALRGQVQSGEFNYIDAYFGDMLGRLTQAAGARASPPLIHLFARLSHALTRQHSCLDVSAAQADALIAELIALPIVGTPENTEFPLILDGTRLYMQRYYQYESRIANALVERNRQLDDIDVARALEIIRELFPDPNWQQVAALQALTRKLSIITGGPGTGKTTTVVKIIRAILALAGDDVPVIRIAAPTGKAAMRLMESMREQNLPIDLEVQTLHRLLGMRADGRSYRHGPEFPVNADLLIVDEVSMIDLAMMHRLTGALRTETRLILLGDPGQLPSVEAGNILADICKHPAGYTRAFAEIASQLDMAPLPVTDSGHLLADAVCELQQNYRFSADNGIGRLSHAVRAGDDITIENDEEVTFTSLAEFGADEQASVYASFVETLAGTADPLERLAAFEQVRILSPVREGPWGVIAVNEAVEATLMAQGLIDLNEPYYPGRPVLVTRNDYNLRLFNGDIGICLRDDTTGEPLVMFRDSQGKTRVYLASRLPPHETCYAMTVHKSQGSEFDRVVLMLPTPSTAAAGQLMTRELIYTAITRARHRVTVCFEGDTLRHCLASRNVRFSGLGDRLLA